MMASGQKIGLSSGFIQCGFAIARVLGAERVIGGPRNEKNQLAGGGVADTIAGGGGGRSENVYLHLIAKIPPSHYVLGIIINNIP